MVRLRGETDDILARLTAEPWVRTVNTRHQGEIEQWRVSVGDEAAAADRLVPTLLTDDRCDVVKFHRSERRLEDAYLEIVGADDGN